MELVSCRTDWSPKRTISSLFREGFHLCFILEDTVRPPGSPKVPGQTAIPEGRYRVKMRWSPKHQMMVPGLLEVPGFSDIEIHPGNFALDTEGCLLPGWTRRLDDVQGSRKAFSVLLPFIVSADRAEGCWISIYNCFGGTNEPWSLSSKEDQGR